MTIRFVQQWNGYSPDTIVTLAGAEETRLIGLGYAVTDLDGPGNTPLPVLASHNPVTEGSTKLLVDGGGYESVGPRNRSILIVGDSIAAYNAIYVDATSTAGHVLEQPAVGFWTWTDMRLKQRFTKRIIKAVGGLKASELVASNQAGHPEVVLEDFLVTPDADECLIFIGTNDLGNNSVGTQTAADIYTLWEAATNSGKRTAVCLVPPRRTGAGAFTAAQTKEVLKCNEMLCNYAATVRGFYVIDTASPLVDYSLLGVYESPATTGRCLFDDVHPNNRGAYLMSTPIFNFYDPIIPQLPIGPLTGIDDFANDADNRNMLICGMFAGTLGAGMATGWTGPTVAGIITAVTNTVVVAPDGVGQAQQIDVTVSAAGFVQIYADHALAEGYTAGETFYGQADFIITGNGGVGTPVGVETPYCKVDMTGGAQPSYTQDGAHYSSGVMAALPSENIEGRLRTAPYRVTGSETSINKIFRLAVYFATAGSARITFWRAAVMENRDYYAPLDVWDTP